MTSLSCSVEDGGEQRTGIINKQPAYVSLADIKAELNVTQEGVYLAKTPDGENSYHWSIIVNDQDVVPCLTDGSISIKVRPTFPGMPVYNPFSFYICNIHIVYFIIII